MGFLNPINANCVST